MENNWKILDRLEQIEEIIDASFKKTQVIFKHSVTCGISAGAKYRLEKDWEPQEEFDFYYLDLLAYRPVSNEVADRLGVIHQSPQVIIVKDGKATSKASHHAIHYSWLDQQVNA